MMILLAFLAAAIGVAPLLIGKRWVGAAIAAVAYTAIGWPLLYFGKPSLAYPLGGWCGGLAVVWLAVSAGLDSLAAEKPRVTLLIPILALLLLAGRGCSGCAAFRADDYAHMIGTVETRDWTQDVQPADPAHIRLVPVELAGWLANKQLGSAGTIGSQFQLGEFTLQRIHGELWYVAPLDHRSLWTWRSSDFAPGYVMVSAEDPDRPVVVKSDLQFHYTPGAYFGENLERHLQDRGFRSSGLKDFSLEIDDAGKAWWVVSVYEPAFAYSGEKILGVALVDPLDGSITRYDVGQTPEWIDRVFPSDTINDYIAWWGKYSGGWWNSWLGSKGLFEPESTLLVYGADGDPYWVTGITSTNDKDDALIGLIYTDVRTGKSTRYNASGGTDNGILQAVNNKVSFRHWHGASPTIYNVNGTMASVVPLLGENHTYQGVAIVSIEDPQRVAIGTSFGQALREYQQLLARNEREPGIENMHERTAIDAKVLRVAQETRADGPTYHLLVEGQSRIFAAGADLSPELSLTQPGDTVRLTFVESRENVVPLVTFDNLGITLGTPDVPPSAPPAK